MHVIIAMKEAGVLTAREVWEGTSERIDGGFI